MGSAMIAVTLILQSTTGWPNWVNIPTGIVVGFGIGMLTGPLWGRLVRKMGWPYYDDEDD
jgi:hypothetical protein